MIKQDNNNKQPTPLDSHHHQTGPFPSLFRITETPSLWCRRHVVPSPPPVPHPHVRRWLIRGLGGHIRMMKIGEFELKTPVIFLSFVFVALLWLAYFASHACLQPPVHPSRIIHETTAVRSERVCCIKLEGCFVPENRSRYARKWGLFGFIASYWPTRTLPRRSTSA